MKVAIMQPYLFPYIGYFQLINSVDYFIVYDNVQYIKGGWINRNRVLLNNVDHLFSFSVNQASLQLNINEREYSPKVYAEMKRFIKTLQTNYNKAPFCDEVIDLISRIFDTTDYNVASFNTRQLKMIASYIGINTNFFLSSELKTSNNLKAEARIIDICQKKGANQYINPIGGQELYSKSSFLAQGITLKFLKTCQISYKQFGQGFTPNLSIIDVLMFNSKEKILGILDEYELI